MIDAAPRLAGPARALALALCLAPLIAGCAAEGIRGDASHKRIGAPATAESVQAAAIRALERRFRLDPEAGSASGAQIESLPRIENVVPGSQLDRFRRTARVDVVPEKEGASVYLQIALERSTSSSAFLYTGPTDVTWSDIGRDEIMEMEILEEIEREAGGDGPATPALGDPPETPR